MRFEVQVLQALHAMPPLLALLALPLLLLRGILGLLPLSDLLAGDVFVASTIWSDFESAVQARVRLDASPHHSLGVWPQRPAATARTRLLTHPTCQANHPHITQIPAPRVLAHRQVRAHGSSCRRSR